MEMTLSRNPERGRCKDEWRVEVKGFPLAGIGHTRADATDALVRSNLELFGISQRFDIDPESPNVECFWRPKPEAGDIYFVELLGGDQSGEAAWAFRMVPVGATLRSVEEIPGLGVWLWYVG